MTPIQTLVIIGCVAAGTMLTRFLPFLIFPENKPTPKWLDFLGKALPPAMMGLLVVYCFKGVNVVTVPFGIPELLACILIVILHTWKRNVLLSIGGGSVFYIFLVNTDIITKLLG